MDPRRYPDEAYSECDEMTYQIQSALGGNSVKMWPHLLMIGAALLFLLIDPRVSGVLILMMIIGLIYFIGRFHVASSKIESRCPDCQILLIREEHFGDEYFVCHKCQRYGRGRANG